MVYYLEPYTLQGHSVAAATQYCYAEVPYKVPCTVRTILLLRNYSVEGCTATKYLVHSAYLYTGTR